MYQMYTEYTYSSAIILIIRMLSLKEKVPETQDVKLNLERERERGYI